MTLLDRYFARRIVLTTFQVLVSLVSLFVVIDLLTHTQDNIFQYEIPLKIVGQFYLTFVPTILFEYHAIALSVLVAGLMVLGKAAQDREIVAALAGGIGLLRLARAPLLTAALIGVAAFAFEETLGAKASAQSVEIEKEYFSRFSQTRHEGISWASLGGGWTCHILKFNRNALTGQDVYLHRAGADAVEEVRAKRIYWDEARLQWVLEDGRWFSFDPAKNWEQRVARITQQPAPFAESPDELFALEEKPDTKSARELATDLNRAAALGMPTERHWVDYYAKFARPALCLIMMLIAIPFAMRVRRGGIAIGFGISIGIGLCYLLVFYSTMGLGHMGKLNPIAAAWLANALFFCAASVLLYRTPS